MGKLRELTSAARRGYLVRFVWGSIRKRFFFESTALGLRCDLHEELPSPSAKIPLTVRPLRDDERLLLAPTEGVDSPEDFYERMLRLRMFDSGMRTCYGAFAEDGGLAYVQWLIEPSQNDLVHDFFEGSFPRLKPDEVLLEGAYTFPSYRGQGVMSAAMAEVAGQGKERGYARAWTFVGEHNTPSLKGCRRAGFAEEVRRAERWRYFRHSFSFSPLAL
jgi:GNAT superfamily N-acetyltransferase